MDHPPDEHLLGHERPLPGARGPHREAPQPGHPGRHGHQGHLLDHGQQLRHCLPPLCQQRRPEPPYVRHFRLRPRRLPAALHGHQEGHLALCRTFNHRRELPLHQLSGACLRGTRRARNCACACYNWISNRTLRSLLSTPFPLPSPIESPPSPPRSSSTPPPPPQTPTPSP